MSGDTEIFHDHLYYVVMNVRKLDSGSGVFLVCYTIRHVADELDFQEDRK